MNAGRRRFRLVKLLQTLLFARLNFLRQLRAHQLHWFCAGKIRPVVKGLAGWRKTPVDGASARSLACIHPAGYESNSKVPARKAFFLNRRNRD
jgi:hypothetical protein